MLTPATASLSQARYDHAVSHFDNRYSPERIDAVNDRFEQGDFTPSALFGQPNRVVQQLVQRLAQSSELALKHIGVTAGLHPCRHVGRQWLAVAKVRQGSPRQTAAKLKLACVGNGVCTHGFKQWRDRLAHFGVKRPAQL